MKILYFTRGQSPHDLRFLNALADSGNQTAVLCLEGSGLYHWPQGIEELTWRGGKNTPNWSRNFRLARTFKQVVEAYQPDVIHAGPIQKVAFIAALARVRPLLSMSWGSDLLLDADRSFYNRRITRLTLSRTTMLSADCQTVVAKARTYGFNGPAVVFPWGVDLEHFNRGPMGRLRRQLGWEKKRVFLSNRTFEPVYGVELVAQAFVQASAQNDNLRLLLFGKGSQEARIKSILKHAETAGKVYFGKFASLTDLPDVYRSADVYVSASHSDGSSVSLLEALACGTPALVSDIPSNREWIEPGKTGWLFPDGNVDLLSKALLEDHTEDEMITLSDLARKLSEERADWKKNFAILLTAYHQLAERNSLSA